MLPTIFGWTSTGYDIPARMTKLPPGFTHELPQHLQQHGHCTDTVMGVPALDFEKFCCGEPIPEASITASISLLLLGAHGFSALIVRYSYLKNIT